MHRLLSTSDFAAAIGVSESSVRRLADRGDLEIHRTRGGHRRIPVAEAIRYVRETGVQVLRPELLSLVVPETESRGASDRDNLLTALSEGHSKAVFSLIQSMYASGKSIAEICDGPVHHAMTTIGERWPSDKRSIFVEHRATLLCLRALCQLRLSVADPDEGAPTALGGAPPDDPYLLPSFMVSLVLHDCGYEETNLGPGTPLDVMVDAVEDERPDVTWLALSNPVRSRTMASEVHRLVDTVCGYGGRTVIGGKYASTVDHPDAIICQSLTELTQVVAIDSEDDT